MHKIKNYLCNLSKNVAILNKKVYHYYAVKSFLQNMICAYLCQNYFTNIDCTNSHIFN